MKPSQRGSSLVPIAFFLPVALMTFVATVDLARAPVMKDRLRNALWAGAYGAEDRASNSPVLSSKLLDQYTPAVNRYCKMSKVIGATTAPGSCANDSLGEKSGFLSDDIANALVNAACTSAMLSIHRYDSGVFAIGGPGGDDTEVGFQFGIVRFPPSALTPELTLSNIDVVGSLRDCSPGFQEMSAEFDNFNVQVVAEKLATEFSEIHDEALGYVGAGLFALQGLEYGSPKLPSNYLASAWLIGVGYLKVEHFFSTFGESRVLVDYFIRPIGNPAGIQANGF